jgi:hypothetical protein
MNNLSRSLYGNSSSVGRGKSGPMIDKILKAKAREDKKIEKLKMLYHPTLPAPKIRKARIYKKKSVIDPEVLAKISDVDANTAEKALVKFLNQTLADMLDVIGDKKTVTLEHVMEALK